MDITPDGRPGTEKSRHGKSSLCEDPTYSGEKEALLSGLSKIDKEGASVPRTINEGSHLGRVQSNSFCGI